MKVVKVFNNNVVAVVCTDRREAVALGSGIGFGKKVNDIIQADSVEKIYYIQDELQTKFFELLKDTNLQYLEIAETVVEKASQVGIQMQHSAIVGLADHISFALERARQNAVLPNLILNELKLLYPEEFKLGKEMLTVIKKRTSILLPEDEAGYIALHIIQSNNLITPEITINTVSFVQMSIKLIEEVYGLKFEESDFYYLRLTTHLKFLAHRVLSESNQKLEGNVDMLHYFFSSNPLHKVFAEKFYYQIKEKFHQKVKKEEVLFIIIHISKFVKR